jgi:hypothetical protein
MVGEHIGLISATFLSTKTLLLLAGIGACWEPSRSKTSNKRYEMTKIAQAILIKRDNAPQRDTKAKGFIILPLPALINQRVLSIRSWLTNQQHVGTMSTDTLLAKPGDPGMKIYFYFKQMGSL